MRRFWTYVGAVLPLAMSSEYASGSVNPHSDPGQKKFPGHSDALDGEGEGGDGQKQAAKPEDGGSPAGIHAPGQGAALETGNDPVTQEIRGLLNELDRMNDTAEMNSPPPAPVYGPASSEMYAPTSTSGGSSGGGSNIAAMADNDSDSSETGVDDTGSGADETPTVQSEADATDVDSMFVALGGVAGGADGTMTDGDIDLQIVDYGQVTVAYGKAEFIATTEWDGTGQPPAAYAETFLDVYDADLVFFYHVDEESVGEDGSYSETSTLYVVAIDYEDDHPLANEFDMTDDNGFEHEYDPGLLLAAYDGTSAGGYFSHPLLDGIPFYAFSQFYGDANGEVHMGDTGSDINFLATTLDGNEDSVVLVGDTTAVEGIGSSATLVAQTDFNGLEVSVSGLGPETYTSIDGQIVETEFGSGITGLAIGIA